MPITVLSPEVVAKIAAGEVVERPASVVKELMENSLDAGAHSIEVHLKDAGKELIHIKDDGCGIPKEDLNYIFQRHATSKIQSIDDLGKLSSLGFRGEALYSIAAVADVVLTSKRHPKPKAKDLKVSLDPSSLKSAPQDDIAWQIHICTGKRLDLKPTAAPPGTEIKITQLFFNTPARRKFLKSTVAEMAQILNVFLPYTILYPQKRFVLTHAGRFLLDLRPAPSSMDRMAAALNLESKDLIEAAQDFKELNAKVWMILSDMNVQRPRRDLQFIFVNNRPVESKSLNYNVNDVYRIILPPGVYPSFMLDIQIDPAEVDVNIHPTKHQVRIRQEARLISFVRHMVEYTLMQSGNVKTIADKMMPPPNIATLSSPNVLIGDMESAVSGPPINTFGGDNLKNGNFDTSHPPAELARPRQSEGLAGWQTATEDLFQTNNTLQTKFARARFIGSFINKYLLFEADQSLFLVDQHAAQERIMFEKFQKQIEKEHIEVQPLLTPIVLKLNPVEKLTWEESQEKLKSIGIETTLFDEDTLAIQTQPVLLKNIENAVKILLSGDDIARCDRSTIARRACKASVVTGDKLDASQAHYQRQQLLACHDPFVCPHGRPTVVELKESFLDRQFLRT